MDGLKVDGSRAWNWTVIGGTGWSKRAYSERSANLNQNPKVGGPKGSNRTVFAHKMDRRYTIARPRTSRTAHLNLPLWISVPCISEYWKNIKIGKTCDWWRGKSVINFYESNFVWNSEPRHDIIISSCCGNLTTTYPQVNVFNVSNFYALGKFILDLILESCLNSAVIL